MLSMHHVTAVDAPATVAVLDPPVVVPSDAVEALATIALLNAADFIDRHGWTRGAFTDSHGRLDLNGAINQAIYGNPKQLCGGERLDERVDKAANVRLMRAVWAKAGTRHILTCVWNDTRCTGAVEAAALLRAAAEVPS